MITGRDDLDAAMTADPAVIPPEEPVLVIRGQDELAGMMARYYAAMAKRDGASDELVASMIRHAARLDAWPVKKRPDLIETAGSERQHLYEQRFRAWRREIGLGDSQPKGRGAPRSWLTGLR